MADGANAWPHCKAAVKALLRCHEVDLLATQEALTDQFENVATLPGFGWAGVGLLDSPAR